MKEVSSISENKKSGLSKKLLYSLGGLVLLLILGVGGYFFYNRFISSEKPVEIFSLQGACYDSFSVGTSPAQVECSKLVDGQQTSESNPAMFNPGEEFEYSMKVVNTSSSPKNVEVKDFVDAFTEDVSNYVDVNDNEVVVQSPVANISCQVQSSGAEQIVCNGGTTQLILEPGEQLKVTAPATALADTEGETIQNNLNSTVQPLPSGDEQSLMCPAYLQITPEPVQDLSCAKVFLDDSQASLPTDYEAEPGDQLTIRVTVENTGDVAFSNVNLTDPLNNTYQEQGSNNLNRLTPVEIASSSSQAIQDSCTLSERTVDCEGLSMQPGESLNLDFLVELEGGDAVDITNVVNVVAGENMNLYCDDTITTTVVNLVCTEDNTCEQVNRELEGGEVSCETDDDCITPTHLECENNACTEVEGSGADQCEIDADCEEEEESHLECRNQACTEVTGDGVDECSTNSDCQPVGTPTHLECRNEACVEVTGSGANECTTNTECVQPDFEEPEEEVPIPETGSGFFDTLFSKVSNLFE